MKKFFVRFILERNQYVYVNTLAKDCDGFWSDYNGVYYNQALDIKYKAGAPRHALLNSRERWARIMVMRRGNS